MATARSVSGAGRAALRASIAALRRGDRAGARERMREIAGEGGAAQELASRVLDLAHDWDGALDVLDRRDPRALRRRFALSQRLGFFEEAHAAWRALAAEGGDDAVWEVGARFHRDLGAWDEALECATRLASLRPRDAAVARLRAELASRADRPDVVRELAADADAETLMRAGLFEEVASRADADGLAASAQIALFLGERGVARDRASAALAIDPDHPRARLARAASSGATDDLDALVRAEDPEIRAEARVRRAEAAWRERDLDRAESDLAIAIEEVPDHLAAKLLWALVASEKRGERTIEPRAYEGLLEGQLASVIDVPDGALTADAFRAALRAALEVLGGNRTSRPTRVIAGRLARVAIPASARHRARAAQHSVLWRGLAGARAELGRTLESLGDHAIALAYLGELELWAGDAPGATRTFERVLSLDARTTWGWIGRASAEVLAGDPSLALRTLAEGERVCGRSGPSVHVVRGEALLRLGAIDEAARALGRATELHPTRASAFVLLGLAHDARGDHAARDRAIAHLDHHATTLLAAARIADPTPAGSMRESLSRLRGSRSSSCALWVSDRGEVRALIHGRRITTPEWERDELASLSSLVA